jgi:hypothetical protein
MPKNMTGGNKAKKGANKESGKAVKNRLLIEDLLDDVQKNRVRLDNPDSDITVGKVEKKLGNCRFHVWLGKDRFMDASLVGRMSGRGGKVFVDIGNLVLIDCGDAKNASLPHIIAVFTAKQIDQLKNLSAGSSLDERFFMGTTSDQADGELGYEFDRNEKTEDGDSVSDKKQGKEEINIDDI